MLSQLHQTLFSTLTAFDHKADLSFQPSDFSAGFVQGPLRLIDHVARSVMGLANRFQIRFHVAQIGYPGLQVGGGFVYIGLQVTLAGLGLAAFDEPQLVLLERAVGF